MASISRYLPRITASLMALSLANAPTHAHAISRLWSVGFEVSAPMNAAATTDLNGNGSPDILIAYQSSAGVGGVAAVEGADGTVLWRAPQTQDYAWMGVGMASVGDVDGDGRSDVAVGTPRQTVNGQTFVGRLDVLSGATGSLLFSFSGTTPSGYFGTTVAALGDINNDQVPDVLACGIGTPFNVNPTSVSYCDAYSLNDGALLYRVFGNSLRAGLGRALQSVPDLDGDGAKDFIASKLTSTATSQYDGQLELRSGRTGAVISSLSGNIGQQLGNLVSALGDVNGDGTQEIAVGIPATNFRGNHAVVVYSVTAAGFTQRFGITPFATTAGTEHEAGYTVISDINNDGVKDIAVGYPSAHTGFSNYGLVRLFSGLNGAMLRTVSNENRVDYFGSVIVPGPDVNGDGSPEFIVGGRGTSPSTSVFSTKNLAKVRFGCGAAAGETINVLGSVTAGSTITIEGVIPRAANSLGLINMGLKPWNFAGFNFNTAPNQCRTGADPSLSGNTIVQVDSTGRFTLNFTIPSYIAPHQVQIYAEAWAINQAGTEVYSPGGIVAEVQ